MPLPMFFTEWIAPAGTNKTSPGLTLASGRAEVVPLQIGSFAPRLLAPNDQHHNPSDQRRSHLNPRCSSKKAGRRV